MQEKQNEKPIIDESVVKYVVSSRNKLLSSRLVVAIISLAVLFTDVKADTSFFRALLIFSASQLLYAQSLEAKFPMRRWFSKFSCAIMWAFSGLSVLGLMGTVELVNINGTVSISFENFTPLRWISFDVLFIFWGLCIAMLAIYSIDWVTSIKGKGDD